MPKIPLSIDQEGTSSASLEFTSLPNPSIQLWSSETQPPLLSPGPHLASLLHREGRNMAVVGVIPEAFKMSTL